MRFEFATANRILFGPGTLREAGVAAREMGRRAFVITGRGGRHAERLLDLLAAEDVAVTTFAVAGEPTIAAIIAATEEARRHGCDLVIGLGGGSPIDAAKAVSALLTNPGDPLDYLEVVGRALPLTRAAAPCIAIPTTAGTGAEVTRNAVLTSPERRVKVSLRSPLMLPRLAIVDPELTADLPPALTASTGLDALTQLIEPFVSIRANPLSDGFCTEGIRRAAHALRPAFHDGANAVAREDMALASLLGGLALANSGLGAVHGFAAPIGGMFSAPHGAVCAALLPHVMEANVQAARQRTTDGKIAGRYARVAQLLTGDLAATPEDGVRWVRGLVRELAVQPLRNFGITSESVPAIVAKASQASSMKANPLPLTPDELTAILNAAL
jgi:alcohol dehydrogenase class IV